MSEEIKTSKPAAGETEFSQQVGEKAARKLKAQRHVTQTVWSGLGMMGLIGWSVAIPTLLGAALGIWLDKHYPGAPFLGADAGYRPGIGLFQCLALGGREDREIHQQEEGDHD